MAKDYFQSHQFKLLLSSYESQRKKNESIYFDADDFADIADYYLSINRPDLSMETVETALSIHPDDEVLRVVKSATYIYQHQWKKAEEVLNTLDSDNPDVKYQWAQMEYAFHGRIPQAEKQWRTWMKIENGTDPSEQHRRENYIHIISSMAELREDDLNYTKEELKTIRKWIREYIDTFQPLGKYDEDIQLADVCRQDPLADLMCEILSQILEEQPYLSKGWTNLALAQLMQKNFDQSLESCDFALAINPEDTDALLTKAHALISLGDKSLSIPVLKKYLELGGERVQAIPYAEALFLDGRKEEAVSVLKDLYEYLEIQNETVEDQFHLDMMSTKLDEAQKREKQKKYQVYRIMYVHALTDICDLFHHNDCIKDSLEVNRRLVEAFPDDAEAFFMMGVNHLSANKYEEAARDFASALKKSNDQVMMGVDIALTFVLNDFSDFALEVLDAISEIADQSNSPYVKNIPAAKSLTYLKLGDKGLFIDNFKIACEDTPDLVQKIYNGIFPEDLPISEWSDYASKHMKSILKKLKH